MNPITLQWYIGYSSGPQHELFADIFLHNQIMTTYVGKSWGQYVYVAGPFESPKAARLAISGSLTRNGLWPEKR